MRNNPYPKTPKPPLHPPTPPGRGTRGTSFANAGCLYYDKDTNKLYWNENSDVLYNDSTTELGDINDIKEITKNLTVVIAKRFLNGEI